MPINRAVDVKRLPRRRLFVLKNKPHGIPTAFPCRTIESCEVSFVIVFVKPSKLSIAELLLSVGYHGVQTFDEQDLYEHCQQQFRPKLEGDLEDFPLHENDPFPKTVGAVFEQLYRARRIEGHKTLFVDWWLPSCRKPIGAGRHLPKSRRLAVCLASTEYPPLTVGTLFVFISRVVA